ncbi:uncharacterized protein BX663DRAFT_555396 [Cokeromyces recurvatus]|uniref:uncharacterized protein n=1 Tax=Cokeromyces recurvatus TaxID=90255 RepID=UPI0022210E8D|nr:uncharacterized protein BX663DRAFT_555396 [Cokeromyces recurvatus]KAI7899064.1 hypothetical protein BX663DRAFT_555396 [Cokeromyces recurvatus]
MINNWKSQKDTNSTNTFLTSKDLTEITQQAKNLIAPPQFSTLDAKISSGFSIERNQAESYDDECTDAFASNGHDFNFDYENQDAMDIVYNNHEQQQYHQDSPIATFDIAIEKIDNYGQTTLQLPSSFYKTCYGQKFQCYCNRSNTKFDQINLLGQQFTSMDCRNKRGSYVQAKSPAKDGVFQLFCDQDAKQHVFAFVGWYEASEKELESFSAHNIEVWRNNFESISSLSSILPVQQIYTCVAVADCINDLF